MKQKDIKKGAVNSNDTYAIMKEYRKELPAPFPSLTKFKSSQILSLAGLSFLHSQN